MVLYRFEYIKHPMIPLKDDFKKTEITVQRCGDELFYDGACINIRDVGQLLDGTVMFLTEDNPHAFIKAIVQKTEENISLHRKYIDDMIQKKTKWEYLLLAAK